MFSEYRGHSLVLLIELVKIAVELPAPKHNKSFWVLHASVSQRQFLPASQKNRPTYLFIILHHLGQLIKIKSETFYVIIFEVIFTTPFLCMYMSHPHSVVIIFFTFIYSFWNGWNLCKFVVCDKGFWGVFCCVLPSLGVLSVVMPHNLICLTHHKNMSLSLYSTEVSPSVSVNYTMLSSLMFKCPLC